MKHFYMVTVQLAYKKKNEEVGVEEIIPLIFPNDTTVNFDAPLIYTLEKQAVKEYYERIKIDQETIEKSNSQTIAISYLGQMESFIPAPKKKEEVN